MSVGECARSLVVASLTDEARVETQQALELIRQQLDTLRLDMSTVLETVLLNLCKDVSEDQIRSFVADNLRSS